MCVSPLQNPGFKSGMGHENRQSWERDQVKDRLKLNLREFADIVNKMAEVHGN
jgi:hypothetical protein